MCVCLCSKCVCVWEGFVCVCVYVFGKCVFVCVGEGVCVCGGRGEGVCVGGGLWGCFLSLQSPTSVVMNLQQTCDEHHKVEPRQRLLQRPTPCCVQYVLGGCGWDEGPGI